jgi:hypothetical protein
VSGALQSIAYPQQNASSNEGTAMPKLVLDQQIVVRIAEPLRTELEAAAEQDGRVLSSMVRRVLVDWAARRVIEREGAAA